MRSMVCLEPLRQALPLPTACEACMKEEQYLSDVSNRERVGTEKQRVSSSGRVNSAFASGMENRSEGQLTPPRFAQLLRTKDTELARSITKTASEESWL